MITKTWQSVQYTRRQYNVIAELRGTLYPDSVMILGAHYDSIISSGDPFTVAPGANDNASGTAAMMEIARVMKKHNYRPGLTIQFVAFGAEELGLLGSYDYAGKLSPSGWQVKYMINNDMIANVSSSCICDWKVNITGYSNAADLLDRSKRVCILYSDISYTNVNTYYNRSDSYPFFVNNHKAVFFMSASDDTHYHTTMDISSMYNYEFCTQVARISCALLVWGDSPELLN
jgi:Zn-dependent M28 family amino/carboxypeptidase